MRRLFVLVSLFFVTTAYAQTSVRVVQNKSVDSIACRLTDGTSFYTAGSGGTFTSGATATAVAPSYVEGSTSAMSQDLAGYLRTRSLHTTAGSPLACRLSDGTNFLASAIGATGAAVPTSGSLAMGTDSGTARALAVNATGRLQVDVITGGGSNASVGSTGAAVPASATYAGVVSGGNLVGMTQPLTDTQLRATAVPVSGTVAATQSGAWTVAQGTAAAGSGAWPMTVTNTSDTVVKPGDAVNNAVRVNVVAGGGSGGTSSSFAAAVPATGTAVGFSDGTNMRMATVTSAGSTYPIDVILRDTSGNAIPSNANGQATMANSTPVVIASDQSQVQVRVGGTPAFATSGLSTATTLTELVAAPAASNYIYITSITFSSSAAATTTTDQQMTLKYGTGSNCGTGTGYLWGAMNPANGGAAISFAQPLRVPVANALCWIHAAAGSKIVTVTYYTGT